MSQLEIAMVTPPWFELPPKAYGGIEAMCSDLVEQLSSRNLKITVIGVGRNGMSVDFVPTSDYSYEDRMGEAIPEAVHASALSDILDKLAPDVVHDHSLAGPLLARGRALPTVVSAHGPVTGDMARYYRGLGDAVRLVAVSDSQRRLAPDLNWVGTVHNAVHVSRFPLQEKKEDFALFLGRTSPEKGIPHAVAAAREAGIRLLIAAKSREQHERRYFKREVEPLLGPGVEWLGEVDRDRKIELLSAARCLLFPVCWEEPFGIVMAEAMACGTPVVALGRGAIPEVVSHGRTGFVCDGPGELADAILDAGQLSPQECRQEAEQRFDVETMADRYEQIYHAVA